MTGDGGCETFPTCPICQMVDHSFDSATMLNMNIRADLNHESFGNQSWTAPVVGQNLNCLSKYCKWIMQIQYCCWQGHLFSTPMPVHQRQQNRLDHQLVDSVDLFMSNAKSDFNIFIMILFSDSRVHESGIDSTNISDEQINVIGWNEICQWIFHTFQT